MSDDHPQLTKLPPEGEPGVPQFVVPPSQKLAPWKTALIVVAVLLVGWFGATAARVASEGAKAEQEAQRREKAAAVDERSESGGTDGGATAAPGDGIAAGVYRAMPKDIQEGNEGTALEFEVKGSGKSATVAWVVGFGMEPTFCKDGGKPTNGPTTFLDDEPTGTVVTKGGSKLEATFDTGFLTAVAGDGATMTGDFAFSFDDLACGGLIDFEAHRTKNGDRKLYDRVMLAGS